MELTEQPIARAPELIPEKRRQSNVELFRIVLMLMIIAHHFIVHGIGYQPNAFNVNNALAVAIEPIGRMAVICFELISGFFLYNSCFKFEKFLKLILEMVFYSLL